MFTGISQTSNAPDDITHENIFTGILCKSDARSDITYGDHDDEMMIMRTMKR